MFKSQGGKFSSVFGTSKDKSYQETLLLTGNSAPKKAFKILFDFLPWYLLSGRKVPCLRQLMMATEKNFQSNY